MLNELYSCIVDYELSLSRGEEWPTHPMYKNRDKYAGMDYNTTLGQIPYE